MKTLLTAILMLMLFACQPGSSSTTPANQPNDKNDIAAMLDSFNVAAANADYNGYFKFYAADSRFIGTDATENWNKDSFMTWAKPYFDKKKTWNFKSVQRNIYFGDTPGFAWFDELLNTQMKICRGSGVVVKENGSWKVKQYVLSMTIPNQNLAPVLAIKTPIEDSLLKVLQP